jgi:phage gp29-like protein
MAFLDNITKIKKSFSTHKEDVKPKMGELAVNDSMYYSKYNIRPYNPDDLISRKGMQIIDRMRTDDMIKASLTLKKFATLAPNFKIIPASNSEEDKDVAEFVTYVMENMQGSMNDALFQILSALDYGFSITELNYQVYEEGKYKDKVGIKNLKTKKPHHYSFQVDAYANIRKRGLILTVDGLEKKLPIDKFIIFSYQKEFGNHYGTSDLRPAYRGFWSKDAIIKFWNIYLERFANPTVIGKYRSNDPNSKTSLRNILDGLTAKTSITHRMDEFDIDFLEPSRSSTEDFKTAINYYDKSIARSILIPDRMMAEGQFGAYSQAKVHFDVFMFVLAKLRQDIEEIVVNEQFIKRLVNMNYGNIAMPTFKFNAMTEDQKIDLNQLFVDAVAKGVITATQEDQNAIRENLHFPLQTDLDKQPKEENIIGPEEVEEDEEVLNLNSQLDLRPTEAMAKEGEKALEWRREHGRGGTEVGIARARQLKNRENLSASTVKRMHSFFSRHEVDKKAEGFRPGEKGYPSNGRIAWAMWGGDPGQSWARNKRNQLETKPASDNQDFKDYSARDKALKKKVEDHNAKYGGTTKRTNMRTLRVVYNRGIGAYRTNPGSVRPTVKSPQQWALARVNSYLYALRNGRFRSGKHDTDLFPKGHPLSSK